SKPPYQTIVFFPGSGGDRFRTSETVLEMGGIAQWIEGGRAVVYPILKGTYERTASRPTQPIAWRERYVQLHKDIARTIDYLETRSDLDMEKLAFIGFSWGGWFGPVVSALEPRLKVNVLISGGLPTWKVLPETDPLNFAPRVTVPTMMINGRYDFGFPFESNQLPLFNVLGTSMEHKRHVVFETGHIIPRNQTTSEASAWLDRYFGPVTNPQ
ncbi:MAG TPA: dienelactone hydrolase family protein, partial [Opitutaceae bacterium]|nr:dienelactone hydrolase family protein [Opitutaceae bacterium]